MNLYPFLMSKGIFYKIKQTNNINNCQFNDDIIIKKKNLIKNYKKNDYQISQQLILINYQIVFQNIKLQIVYKTKISMSIMLLILKLIKNFK